jgi:hypothetical protein
VEEGPAYTPVGGHRDFFACYLCLKIRSADNFTNTMMKSKRGKLGQGTLAERSKRFCIQCGVSYGQYRPGTYIQFGGAAQSYGFVCWGCGIFWSIGHCTEAQIATRRCPVCWSRSARPHDISGPDPSQSECRYMYRPPKNPTNATHVV